MTYLSFKKAIVRAVDKAATIASGLLRNPNPTHENFIIITFINNFKNSSKVDHFLSVSLPRINRIMRK